MSTQENLTERKERRALYPATLALLFVIFLNLSSWIWSSLYFQRHTLNGISIGIGVLIFLLIGCITLIRLPLGHARTRKLINLCIALLLTYFGFNYFKQLGLIPEQSNALQETLAVSSALAAGLLSFKINLDVWKRLQLAVIVGGLIFIFFPVLLATTHAPTVYWPSPSYQAPTLKPPELPTQNTIVLLLDELSANAAGPVVAQLNEAGLHVTSISVDSAGKNTLNVIPAIWSKKNFDQSVPCGPTQLCSTSQVLDFAKVQASSENIDIVGFYHRYCSIQGLRSCFFAPMPASSTVTNVACSFPGIDKLGLSECNAHESGRKSWITVRDNLQKKLLEAPFWQKGGILFAHLLAPHPLMGIPLKSLQDEYTDNIADGAELVKRVAQKAKLVFGNDFKIIVFSDHPLRSDLWCADKYYRSFGCTPTSAQISTQVPLIVATPANVIKPAQRLRTNKNVFDLLY